MTRVRHLLLSSGLACGRQLSSHRELRAQDTASMLPAEDAAQFMGALRGETPKLKACRWCARAVGLIPPVTRQSHSGRTHGGAVDFGDEFNSDEMESEE